MSSGPWPLLDQRRQLPLAQRLPARCSTTCLWLGSFSLIGVPKLLGLLLLSGLVAPAALLLDRSRRLQPPAATMALSALPVDGVRVPAAALPRAQVAARLGMPEAQLFRARHTRCCTVHHDDAGRIVALVLPQPPALRSTRPSADAHPVG